jgi:hypothetical protein
MKILPSTMSMVHMSLVISFCFPSLLLLLLLLFHNICCFFKLFKALLAVSIGLISWFQTNVNSYYMFDILSLWISNILSSCNNWYATSYYLFNLRFKDLKLRRVLIIVASHLPKYWQQLITFKFYVKCQGWWWTCLKLSFTKNWFFFYVLFFQLYHPIFVAFILNQVSHLTKVWYLLECVC